MIHWYDKAASYVHALPRVMPAIQFPSTLRSGICAGKKYSSKLRPFENKEAFTGHPSIRAQFKLALLN